MAAPGDAPEAGGGVSVGRGAIGRAREVEGGGERGEVCGGRGEVQRERE